MSGSPQERDVLLERFSYEKNEQESLTSINAIVRLSNHEKQAIRKGKPIMATRTNWTSRVDYE